MGSIGAGRQSFSFDHFIFAFRMPTENAFNFLSGICFLHGNLKNIYNLFVLCAFQGCEKVMKINLKNKNELVGSPEAQTKQRRAEHSFGLFKV